MTRHAVWRRMTVVMVWAAALGGCGDGATSSTGSVADSVTELPAADDIEDALSASDSAAELPTLPETTAGPDATAETAPADVVPAADGGCTAAGCACTSNASCESGLCLEVGTKKQCAALCQGGCAEGFQCTQVAGSGGDIISVCAPAFPRRCDPCQADSDCNNVLGGADSRCIPYKDASGALLGQFCGGGCSDSNPCGAGYACQDAVSVGGVPSKQCVRQDLQCPCSERAIELSLVTPCSSVASAGTCSGKRTCAAGGLGVCTAATAQPEQCNGKDDDCDGQTDEPSVGMCDDQNPCSYDNCQGGGECQHPPKTGSCDDGSACTANDTCQDGECKGEAKLACNDGNPCTDETCDAKKGCSVSFNQAVCTDNNLCTETDTCKDGQCMPGTAKACDDGNPCTTDACDAKSGCVTIDNTLPCKDNNLCTEGEACQGGQCQGGQPKACDDGNPCTTDLCDAAKGCVAVSNAEPCSDNNVCTEADACLGGKCLPGKFKGCDDGNPCTSDTCDPQQGCTFAANTAPCDDGSICTLGDVCAAKACVAGVAVTCNDGNSCTDDSCDKVKGCTHAANQAQCSDSNVCSEGDQCKGGTCIPGKLQACSDGNPCTSDACDVALGCQSVPNAAACSDGSVCTVGDACQDGQCKPGSFVSCDDGNPCTNDGCDGWSGCFHLPNAAPCSDGNTCTQDDACQQGACKPGKLLGCTDGNPCTDDLCDPASGCIALNNAAPCTDGSVCTVGDICSGGACKPGAAVTCNDGNPCTDDTCDPTAGCKQPLSKDDTPCGQGVCKSGQCTCASGYSGNGSVCTDINECAAGTAGCDANAACANTVGGFSCTCKPGWKGDGKSCTSQCGDGLIVGGEVCDGSNFGGATCATVLGAGASGALSCKADCSALVSSGCILKPGTIDNPAASCKAILDAAPGSASGLYYIKTGAFAAFQAYCDMGNGGPWMLTHVSKNPGNNISSWFPNAGAGGGSVSNLPKAPASPGSGWSSGPDFATRWSLWQTVGGTAYRATKYDNNGTVLLDVVKSDIFTNKVGMFCWAAGCGGTPAFVQVQTGSVKVIGGTQYPSGGTYSYTDIGEYNCNCSEAFAIGDSCAGCGNGFGLAGDWDTEAGYTAFWIR